MASIPSSDQLLSIGRIQTAYGIKGWVWLYSNTAPTTNIFAYTPWYLQVGNAAEALQGAVIWTAKTNLPALTDGDYYWSDLLDMSVWTIDGQLLGEVDSMMETGANDVLVVKPVAGSIDKTERLIPWLPDQVVTAVDVANRRLTVDWDIDF